MPPFGVVLISKSRCSRLVRGSRSSACHVRPAWRSQSALRVAFKLEVVAARLGQPPAAVAIAYALANPLVASVLFGATSPEHVQDDCQALEALDRLTPPVLDELRTAAGTCLANDQRPVARAKDRKLTAFHNGDSSRKSLRDIESHELE